MTRIKLAWGFIGMFALCSCGSPGKSRELPSRTDADDETVNDDAGPSDDVPTKGDVAIRGDVAANVDLESGPDGLTSGKADARSGTDATAVDAPTCGPGQTCQCGGVGQPCCAGSTCIDDGDACNGTEVCQGTCQHQNPVVCTALDVCHDVGQCQPATGMCTNPKKTGGSCNDNDPCTQNDTCQSGVCKGSALPCSAGQRCVSGSCVCDQMSCASGCCAGNQCQPGTGDATCGTGGGGCNICTSSQICKNRSCAACGGPGEICCTGQSCSAGKVCSSGICLRQVTFDCDVNPSRTGYVNYHTGTMVSTPYAVQTRGFTGRVQSLGHQDLYNTFVTFSCTNAASMTGLQTATFRIYQASWATVQGNAVEVAHVTFDSLADMTYEHWTDMPLDTPGSYPATDVVEYKTVDVTASVKADLAAARTTQFRLNLPIKKPFPQTDEVTFDLGADGNPPTLRLVFLIP